MPSGGKLDARVRGPHVTPGYYRRADLTKEAFDEEGFYRIGDARRLVDPGDPAQGLAFDGRVAEDFKLSSGTWVSVGAVPLALLGGGEPAPRGRRHRGHDRDEIGVLVFLKPAVAKDLVRATVRTRISSAIRSWPPPRAGARRTRCARSLLTKPPAIDPDEITDKGYINQRAVLERRAALVERLHAAQPLAEVIRAG